MLLLQVGRPAQVGGTGTKLKRNQLEFRALSGERVPRKVRGELTAGSL